MQRSILIVIVLACVLGGVIFYTQNNYSSTEKFINSHFINQQSKVKTYVNTDEYLSESIGLYMRFLLLTNQKEAFQKQAKVVKQLSKDGFIEWRSQDAHSNASVDDLRIIAALYVAAENWGNKEYKALGDEIKSYIKIHQLKRNLVVDFYDVNSGKSSNAVHLSYIDAEAMKYFEDEVEQEHSNLLTRVSDNIFFPEVYKIETGVYTKQKEVNMIDQSLIALNSNKFGIKTDSFLNFVEDQLNEEGKVYGRYERNTLKPTVLYESPSVYAILTMTYLEMKEVNMAEMFYNRMKKLQDDDGGYKMADDNAHFFDNILPAIAEERISQY